MGIFDYQVPDVLANQIKVGQLVSIPFRKKEMEGVVIKIKKEPIAGKKIKKISKIIDKKPLLTPEQIKLAEWISQYYFVSLGTIIKTILPPIPQRKILKFKTYTQSLIPQPKLPFEISDLIYKITRSKKQNFLFWPNTLEQKIIFLYWVIKRIKKNILIIVP